MKMKMNNQRLILKVSSLTLRNNNWNYNISLDQAKRNEEVIALGDSQCLRFIRDIIVYQYTEEDIYKTKKHIEILKRKKNTDKVREEIQKAYDKLDDMLFVSDYVSIVFKSKKDFDYACKKGFYINGKKFKRLIGTTGGVKQSVVQFCNEEIHEELNRRMENGWNKNTPIVPAKFEAYKALSCSVSTPVTMPRMIIIKDGSVNIKDNVIKVGDNGEGGFNVEYNVPYEAEKQFTDGAGMMTPEMAMQWAIDLGQYYIDKDGNKVVDYIPSGYNTRFSYSKGVLACFDFKAFAEEVANEYMIEDCWGHMRDVREADVILTDNMMKLTAAYSSMEDYLENCHKNGYEFCITKITPKELEKKRSTNYQYLQSYEDMSDNDIEELISETVENINGALGDDIRKAILFTRGSHITEGAIRKTDPDFTKALMIDENVINDSYVKQQIYKMISRKINDAKMGVLQISGNYAMIVGDMYALCQHMFKMPVTGLLGFGEFYSGNWLKQGIDEVIAFRSPMTSHNNIRRLKFISNPETDKWFKYLDTMIVFNAFDTTCDALNGADFDSDSVITTNNPIILKNTKDLQSIICEQRSIPKTRVTEALLRKSNKNGFGDAIGTYTNRITTMFDVLATLEKGSPEYNELMGRIIQGQAYQQEVIDKIKGVEAKAMPREWYDYKANKIKTDNETGEILDDEETIAIKEKNLKLIVNKKPYFFIYNYNMLKSDYSVFMNNANNNSLDVFGKEYEEILYDENRSQEEDAFVNRVKKRSPVFNNNCVMNRISHRLEEMFEETKLNIRYDSNFNYSVYKTDMKYKKEDLESINGAFKEFKKELSIMADRMKLPDSKFIKDDIVSNFKNKLHIICPNEEMLTNIIIDITYGKGANKKYAWDICGEQIIRNLLSKNNNQYKYPVMCEDGDFEWNGYKFKMEVMEE